MVGTAKRHFMVNDDPYNRKEAICQLLAGESEWELRIEAPTQDSPHPGRHEQLLLGSACVVHIIRVHNYGAI